MSSFDVFNGDADGICALIQLRLAEPKQAKLVAGVKRDIGLVSQVPVGQARDVTVLDVSLDKNRQAVDALLQGGSRVFYVDHHFPGDDLPNDSKFKSLIDIQPTTCTSLLVDKYLGGRFHNWAIAAAFGDNLNAVADDLAKKAGLSSHQALALSELGVCINYNGYGASLADLYYHPADLYRELVAFSDPLEVIQAAPEYWRVLSQGCREDMDRGLTAQALCQSASVLVIRLPDEAWARRVSGVLGNELANRNPDLACAIVTESGESEYLVSIRAPLNNRTGADEVARQFPTGGGRKAAAGINQLPADMLGQFIDAMNNQWK